MEIGVHLLSVVTVVPGTVSARDGLGCFPPETSTVHPINGQYPPVFPPRSPRQRKKKFRAAGCCTSNPSFDRVSANSTANITPRIPHSFLPQSPLKPACRRRPAARINIQIPHSSTFPMERKAKIRSVMYSTDYQLNKLNAVSGLFMSLRKGRCLS